MENSNFVIVPQKEWEHINQMLDKILSLMEETRTEFVDTAQVMDRKDIARRQSVSLSQLRREPWRMPNYGISELSARRVCWHRSTYLAWEANLEKYRKSWNSMSLLERKARISNKE